MRKKNMQTIQAKYKLLRIRESIGFSGYLIFNKDFVTDTVKNMMKKTSV